MGKRARKTRWRALDIADDHSDSEESNTNSSAVSSRYSRSNSNGYYSKFSYSSQSTPARRRYNQYDGSTKSTRSSSTTSETKITFNEDEYTRITTPRQDVLFKKGYLNKPKVYQTQTSTGNSTISTGNSTENGTPDHQSTDLDYESQFVFPNGFVDHNGIYYVNSYEPYPLMLFNPPTYYQEFSNSKSKRYSTGSWSESMSPNNEEATSQDLSQSGGEASNSGVSDYSGPPVFNMVYPGYYVNGTCTPTDLANTHDFPPEPVKKLKKRRERKSSKTIPGDSSEYTDENSGDENASSFNRVSIAEHCPDATASRIESPAASVTPTKPNEPMGKAQQTSDKTIKTATTNQSSLSNGCADEKTETNEEPSQSNQVQPTPQISILKPDAEEFIPRAYQPLGHIKMMPPSFMPIPLVPIGEFGAQNFGPHPAFIPPGFPINFVPHHVGQKMYTPAADFVIYPPPIVHETKIEEKCDQNEEMPLNEERERESTATPSHTPDVEETAKPPTHNSKAIDIATVMVKLEAVKQQEMQDTEILSVKPILVNETKPFRGPPRVSKPQNLKRNYYNKYRNSPVRSGEASPRVLNGDANLQGHYRQSPVRNGDVQIINEPQQTKTSFRNSPIRLAKEAQKPLTNGLEKINGIHSPNIDYSKQSRKSPERFQKKNWKQNDTYQTNHASPKRPSNYTTTHQLQKSNATDRVHANKVCSDSPKKILKPETNQEPKAEPLSKPKSNNQWISVSSRKKKKNKNQDDADLETNEEVFDDAINNKAEILFESYEVSQLVDVIPPSHEEKRIEEILTSIAQSETPEVLTNGQTTPTNINIVEVSDIEKSIIDKLGEESSVETVNVTVPVEEKTVEATTSVMFSNEIISNSENNGEEEMFKPKKRSKKGTQKPLTKKIIITDVFDDISLPSTTLETQPATKEVVKKIEEVKLEETTKESTPESEQQEKKPKKKKKNKTNKSFSTTNESSINDDSLDSILENSLTNDETVGKTNDEISLELDKLIRKGMYNSLQEKMKSINVEPDADDFFKTIGTLVNPEKSTAALKAPDFNRIFQSTRQFLKPNMVSVEHDNKVDKVDDRDSKTCCSSTVDAADPSAGPALVNASSERVFVDPNIPADDEKLYPITLAVREWMCKTREATPEVEILKSPSTIQREFGALNNAHNTEQLDSDVEDEDDEDVTLFSSEEMLLNQDLLEYWEDDLASSPKDCDLSKDVVIVGSDNANKLCAVGKSCDKSRTDSIKQDEDEIGVYESKYGQNEAYLHLQKEFEKERKNASRSTRQLPHRAVCCSLQ